MIELRYFQFMVDSKLINKHLKSGTVYSLPFREAHDFIVEIVRAYVPHGCVTIDRLRNRTAGYVTGWPVT